MKHMKNILTVGVVCRVYFDGRKHSENTTKRRREKKKRNTRERREDDNNRHSTRIHTYIYVYVRVL